jgi:hypothetical protein
MAVETTARPIVSISQIQQGTFADGNFVSDAAFVVAKGSIAANGDRYYNTASHVVREYVNGSWTSLADISSTQSLAAKTLTGLKLADSSSAISAALASTDVVKRFDATSGTVTATLPTSVGIAGTKYTIVKIDSSSNFVALTTTSSQTINGNTTVYLGAQYESISVISDGANWLITERPFKRQYVKGTAQTSNGSLTSTSFADFTNQPTVSITPIRSRDFKVYGTFSIGPAAAADCYLKILASVGSPTVVFSQEAFYTASSTQTAALSPYLIVTLTANTAYTFKLQGKSSASTLSLYSASATSGHALIVEELT